MHYLKQHNFHIPVMGLAYTIDSPIKVARFGISSVISIVEDRLIEMMRSHYYPSIGKEYLPLPASEPDYRAARITDYLDLVNNIVQSQFEKLRKTAFEKGSEINKYFEMLPENNVLKKMYCSMMNTTDMLEKSRLENQLRKQMTPGSIDVNIMTKVDRNIFDKDGELVENGSDAVAALRGYANSTLTNSAVVFSAGMNPRLYNYLETCKAFDVNEDGGFSKKVIIKVSDYRSALIQGKYLAKKGIWVSEFRIESGLNCGGHAFATDGLLLGPILEEFRRNKQELIDTLFELYNTAIQKKNHKKFIYPPVMLFSVQGGIGTCEEDEFMHSYYQMDSTGWGTPFLLVPEATTVDEETLQLLSSAKEKDIVLSRNSPLGVRFHYLRGTSSDIEKKKRISAGKPGSPCTEKHLAFNTEFTEEPICTASRKYQQLKIAQLQTLGLSNEEYKVQEQEVLDKECLCVGLSNAAAIQYGHTFIKKRKAVNICPGPNIVNFSKIVSLQTMTDHIYGRKNIMTNEHRPHMFVAELHLYIDFLKEQIEEDKRLQQFEKKKKYYTSFCENMRKGISYYQKLSLHFKNHRETFLEALAHAETELDLLNYQYEIITGAEHSGAGNLC